MTRNANAAPGRAAQAAIERARDHLQDNTRLPFRHSSVLVCGCCGLRLDSRWMPRHGDARLRCPTCGHIAERWEYVATGRATRLRRAA